MNRPFFVVLTEQMSNLFMEDLKLLSEIFAA
jgi:hypothetical protein